MSAKYWKNRWIKALVDSGIEPNAAEAAYAEAYKNEPADDSKSPEIQAMIYLPQAGRVNAAQRQSA